MYVKVRVRAGWKREEFEPLSPASFKISVRQKAQNNAANRRVVLLIASHFKVPAKSVRIASGHRSPSKTLVIPTTA
ncbi:MAG TPA: DUF167 domain-containing protein [Candidatus Paceibacterota bacterium]